jgi:hypothetical protein
MKKRYRIGSFLKNTPIRGESVKAIKNKPRKLIENTCGVKDKGTCEKAAYVITEETVVKDLPDVGTVRKCNDFEFR